MAFGLRSELVAFLGFAERQKNLVRRYWAWEAVWLVYSMVSVLSIGYLASGLQALGSGGSFDLKQAQLYLLIGSVLWGYMSLVFFEIAYAIGWERWEGTIEHTFMAPVRRVTHLMGICAFAMLYGLARTAVVLAVAELLFHLDFSHADPLAAVAVMAAATPAIVGIAVLAAVLPLLSPEKGDQMTVAVQGVVLLVSGVYYPISVLPRHPEEPPPGVVGGAARARAGPAAGHGGAPGTGRGAGLRVGGAAGEAARTAQAERLTDRVPGPPTRMGTVAADRPA